MKKTVATLSLIALTTTGWADSVKVEKKVNVVTVETFCTVDSYKPKIEKVLRDAKRTEEMDLLDRAASDTTAVSKQFKKLCKATQADNKLTEFLEGFGEACLEDCLATLDQHKSDGDYQSKQHCDSGCGAKTATSDWRQCKIKVGDAIPNTINPKIQEGCRYACAAEGYRMRSVRAQNDIDSQACKGDPHTTSAKTSGKKTKRGAEQVVRLNPDAPPVAGDADPQPKD